MTPIVRGIQPREVEALWPNLSPLIERGLRFAGGCFGLADVQHSLIEGRRQLWVTSPALDCALVTEQIDYPLKRVLHVFLVAGRLPRAPRLAAGFGLGFGGRIHCSWWHTPSGSPSGLSAMALRTLIPRAPAE